MPDIITNINTISQFQGLITNRKYTLKKEKNAL